jgi:serine-type D-Ala-D-Ala carboxypeptidase/endopeptidase (penicillin-binding protein 4)
MSVLLLLGACSPRASEPPGPAPAADLPTRVDLLLAEPPFDRVHWGVLVVDEASGRTVYERNADLMFIPGSNAKVPAVAAALGRLGPAFRWETSIYAQARPVGGVLPGDAYLVGRGDPSLGPPFHDSGTAALRDLVDALTAAGIEAIDGRLVVDVSAWDSTSVPDSWMVEDLPVTFGATGGAFAIDRGEVEIRVTGAGREGNPATVEWDPPGRADGSPFVDAGVTTSAAGDGAPALALSFLPESGRWRVDGTIPVGETTTIRRAARDPVRLAAATLHTQLLERGIAVDTVEIAWDPGIPVEGTCLTGDLPSCPGMLRLAGVASPPLADIATEVLGASQNWMAEQVLRTLGQELGDAGSWPEGIAVMSEFLTDDVGLSPSDYDLEDGSGMSNHNLLSPRALVAILRHAATQPWGEVFRDAMAEPGEAGATLENRLGGLEGRAFAKTGSLSHVNSLSGYLDTVGGRRLVFSILSNGAHLPASQVRARIDEVVRALAGD